MGAGKNTAARVQGKKSRGYTRGSGEKRRRAGTGEEIARIYPWERGKMPPRGYRERKRADIPVGAGKNAAARVQGKKSRGYTRGSGEKRRRAGTGKENARIYPWKRGKTPPRGYRGRNRADIPVVAGKNAAARVQGKKSRGYTRGSGEKHRRAGTGKDYHCVNLIFGRFRGV